MDGRTQLLDSKFKHVPLRDTFVRTRRRELGHPELNCAVYSRSFASSRGTRLRIGGRARPISSDQREARGTARGIYRVSGLLSGHDLLFTVNTCMPPRTHNAEVCRSSVSHSTVALACLSYSTEIRCDAWWVALYRSEYT